MKELIVQNLEKASKACSKAGSYLKEVKKSVDENKLQTSVKNFIDEKRKLLNKKSW